MTSFGEGAVFAVDDLGGKPALFDCWFCGKPHPPLKPGATEGGLCEAMFLVRFSKTGLFPRLEPATACAGLAFVREELDERGRAKVEGLLVGARGEASYRLCERDSLICDVFLICRLYWEGLYSS